MAGKVFLSYSHKDGIIATLLYRELVRSGLHAWMDEHNVQPGTPVLHEVASALNDADYVCVLLSRNSVKSTWVKKEIALVATRELQIGQNILIPIVLDDCERPHALADKLYVDFSRPELFREQLRKLIMYLGGAFLNDQELYMDPFNVLYTFNDLVAAIRNEQSSRLDILLINGGATIPALIGPHVSELIQRNSGDRLAIRMVLLDNDYRQLVADHQFEDGYSLVSSQLDGTTSQRSYEALILESRCLQTIGIHAQQIRRSVETMQEIAARFSNVTLSIRFNSRFPFCRLILLEDVGFYTPFLSSLPFNFFTLRLPVSHVFLKRCREHFEFLYDTGHDETSSRI